MQLPLLLPKKFAFLSDSENEEVLFSQLSSNLNQTVDFLAVALADVTWSENHPEFIRKMIRWLTDLFYHDQIGIELAEKIKPILYAHPQPLLPFDLTLQIGNSAYPINSLMLSAASPYFYRLIRDLSDTRGRELKVACSHPSSVKNLLKLAHEGPHDLWKLEESQLEEILSQARMWNFDEIGEAAEKILERYLKPENAIEGLLKARKQKWGDFEQAAARVYNHNAIGLKLYTPAPSVLLAEFRDLKELTTLHDYKSIAPIVSICRFTGLLPQDPDFKTAIKMTPHLTGLDLSETEAPPTDLEAIPRSITSLYLTKTPWLNDEELIRLLERFRDLTTLVLQESLNLRTPSWTAVTSLKKLISLDLSQIKPLRDEDLYLLALNLPALENLSLSGCKKITSASIQELIRGAPRLTHLNLAKTGVDDKNLSEIGLRLPRLLKLDLSDAPYVSDRAIQSLKRANPRLTLLSNP